MKVVTVLHSVKRLVGMKTLKVVSTQIDNSHNLIKCGVHLFWTLPKFSWNLKSIFIIVLGLLRKISLKKRHFR